MRKWIAKILIELAGWVLFPKYGLHATIADFDAMEKDLDKLSKLFDKFEKKPVEAQA